VTLPAALAALLLVLPHGATALLPAEAPWTLAPAGMPTPRGHPLSEPSPPDPHAFQSDHFLLVVPLWSEDGYRRTIIAAYNVDGLPLPSNARVHRVLVPNRVETLDMPNPLYPEELEDPDEGILALPPRLRKPVPEGPWREVGYRVEQHDGITLLKPERVVSGVFAVEASLPEREGWVRIALTPGNWLVLLGWARDFNLLTTDDKVLFRGRAPYDEVQYDLGDVSIVFWYCGYALDLKGHPWYEEIFRSMTIWDAAGRLKDRCSDYDSPRGQYELGFFLGQGIIIRVSTRKPVVLEFKTLKYALKYGDFMRYFGYRGFYTFTYWVRHSPHGLLKYVCLAVLPTMVLLGMATYKLTAQLILPPLPIRGRSRRRGAA